LILGALAFALAILVSTAGYHIVAGEKEGRQGDERAPSSSASSAKGSASNSNSRWFADPKRGWIRSDEREEQQKNRAAEQDRNENSAREKASRVIWEY